MLWVLKWTFLNQKILLKTKYTLLNLLIRETSQFLCYERLLNLTYVAYKDAFFRKMEFWLHCNRVVAYQALCRLSGYKIPGVYLSSATYLCFCTIRDFGSPTITMFAEIHRKVFFFLHIFTHYVFFFSHTVQFSSFSLKKLLHVSKYVGMSHSTIRYFNLSITSFDSYNQ